MRVRHPRLGDQRHLHQQLAHLVAALAVGGRGHLHQRHRQAVQRRRRVRMVQRRHQARLGDAQLRRGGDRAIDGGAGGGHVTAARLPACEYLGELQARLRLAMRQVGVEPLRQPVPVRGVGQQGRVQRRDSAQLAAGDSRLQRVHRAVALALRLLRPGQQQRPDRVGQRLVRQLRITQLRLLPVAVMRRACGQQKLRQRVGGQRARQLRGLAVAGQQREHERVFPQFGVGGVARQRVRHAGRSARRIALMRGELGHQEIRRPRRLGGGREGDGQKERNA